MEFIRLYAYKIEQINSSSIIQSIETKDFE